LSLVILTFYSVSFTDSNTGWAVGDNGVIVKSTDGGEHWILQSSGVVSPLRSVYFIDSNTGWAVGDGGIILHTTNGGVSFVEEEQIKYQQSFYFCRITQIHSIRVQK